MEFQAQESSVPEQAVPVPPVQASPVPPARIPRPTRRKHVPACAKGAFRSPFGRAKRVAAGGAGGGVESEKGQFRKRFCHVFMRRGRFGGEPGHANCGRNCDKNG